MERKTKNSKKILLTIIFPVILIGAIIIFWKPLTQFFLDTEHIREFVSSFGILAPIIFIAIVILQVLLSVIPGQVIGLAGGYLFGIFFGTLYSMIGLVTGSLIVFYISRKLGRTFVERIIKKKTLDRFDKLVKKKGVLILFLIFLLPGLPDDVNCYIAGLTKIKIRTLVIICTIGRFPGALVLSIVGAGLVSNTLFSIIFFAIMMIISLIIYLKRNELEQILFSIAKKINPLKFEQKFKNSNFINNKDL